MPPPTQSKEFFILSKQCQNDTQQALQLFKKYDELSMAIKKSGCPEADPVTLLASQLRQSRWHLSLKLHGERV
jgi:hypothetical protein